MNYRLMFTLNAIAVAAFGVLFLAIPDFALSLFNTETYASTLFVTRFLGAGLLLAGIFIWLMKDVTDPRVERTMVIVLLTSSVVGFVLSLIGVASSHVLRQNGWILMVIHLLFTLGYGFLLSGVAIVPKSQQQQQEYPR